MNNESVPLVEVLCPNEPPPQRAVPRGSSGVRASCLSPEWRRGPEPIPWLCDGRTLAKFANVETLDVRSCAALWCGYDPDMFNDPRRAEVMLRAWRAEPELWAAFDMPLFLLTLDAATAALRETTLRAVSIADDVGELTLVTAEAFSAWASNVGLARPTDPRRRDWPWGVHTTPLLDTVRRVMEVFFRTKQEGGPYDASDPSTHPSLAEFYEALLRESSRRRDGRPSISRTMSDALYTWIRDPHKPKGRPRKNGR